MSDETENTPDSDGTLRAETLRGDIRDVELAQALNWLLRCRRQLARIDRMRRFADIPMIEIEGEDAAATLDEFNLSQAAERGALKSNMRAYYDAREKALRALLASVWDLRKDHLDAFIADALGTDEKPVKVLVADCGDQPQEASASARPQAVANEESDTGRGPSCKQNAEADAQHARSEAEKAIFGADEGPDEG